ncbi:hypothetical protein EI555_016601 [Monodon monoceros]|uniref:KN homeodomain domain-containing protein n=1 Tax=Monodon monoceros TaxID=40151 RepID=A0A4U1EV02_MONMO|nr:hypothetical protein EI555_016601 [Monodon monoceros]
MNTIVFNKLSGAVIFEDRGAPERERGGRPYGGVLDSTHARPEVGITDGAPLKDNLGLRHRRTGARQNGGKVRHKRQALQDMARPLKQWLYKHRDNPYPTKTEKILLALGSQMTLVQGTFTSIAVFTVDPTKHDDGENPPRNHMNEEGYNNPVHHPVIKSESSVIKAGVRPESRANEDYVSPPKYKSSLLNRYLNDSLRHVMVTNAAMMGKTRQRNHSGSFSSNEFEEELVSPSSSETEGNFVYRTGDREEDALTERQLTVGTLRIQDIWALLAIQSAFACWFEIFDIELRYMLFEHLLLIEKQKSAATGFLPVVCTLLPIQTLWKIDPVRVTANRKGPSKDDTYWKEINAAMALTNLAQGKDKLQGTTSCIIQKSSHIAEVKTVKVPLVQQF